MYSQTEPRLERPGLGEGECEDGKRDADCTASNQGRPVWRVLRELHPLTRSISFLVQVVVLMLRFLDDQVLSADKVSDADTAVSSPQVKDGNPV